MANQRSWLFNEPDGANGVGEVWIYMSMSGPTPHNTLTPDGHLSP